jgi:hypothetical protein
LKEEIVKRWYEKAEDEDVPMDKFICYWISFNCFFRIKPSAKGERMVIEELSKDQIFLSYFTEGIDESLFKYIKVKEHNKGFVQDLRHKLGTQKEIENRATYDKVSDLKQFLFCIYQIRCNLFHGDKLPDDSNDLKLFEASNESFGSFLKKIYNKEHILT